jgi:pyruvate-ferredoxin/flavodoxin oxidoreductase
MAGSNSPGDKRVEYPGIPTTADGAEAVVWVETNITQMAGAYPITSSSKMGEGYDYAVSNGFENLWGERILFLEPESEHSAATICEGFAVAGGRATTFTSGQGLILMKEVLYVIAGKGLPIVFHIGARALTSQSLNVHAGHDDVMGVADCGWGMVFGKNAQEAGDLAAITRRAAEDCMRPIMSVQDGFLTTHTVESILQPEAELLERFVGPPNRTPNLFTTDNPIMTGVVQNQDSYMKGKIAQRAHYGKMAGALKAAMDEWTELTGRKYDLVDAYRMEDAEYALIGMGSMMETAMATADYLRDNGKRVGVVHVTTFRPFPGPDIIKVLVKRKNQISGNRDILTYLNKAMKI